MKKDIFDFRRFGKYFMSDIRTCAANYGLGLSTVSILSFLILYAFGVGFSMFFGDGWSGPGIGARSAAFIFVMLVIVITMPVRSYGKLTEKQYGSQWLMIPASRLEKFLSMILISCIIVPVLGTVLYLGIDALFCAFDPTCGDSLIRGMINLESIISNGIQEAQSGLDAVEYESIVNFISQLSNPWLYIDDGFGMVLPFLLGALVFKSGKTVKTILALFAFSTVTGFISTPIMMNWLNTMSDLQAASGYVGMSDFVIFDSWLFRNITLVDTISDTIANLGLLVAIFFRIRTLKH